MCAHPTRPEPPSPPCSQLTACLSLASEPKVKIVTMYIDQPGGYPSSKPTPFDELPMGIRMAEKCPDQSTHIALCLSVCLSVSLSLSLSLGYTYTARAGMV